MGVGDQHHAPAALPPRKTPGTHCTRGCVGPTAGLDGCRISRPLSGFDPRTVQPAASRYADLAIPAHTYSQTSRFIDNAHGPKCMLLRHSVLVTRL